MRVFIEQIKFELKEKSFGSINKIYEYFTYLNDLQQDRTEQMKDLINFEEKLFLRLIQNQLTLDGIP